VIHFELLRDRKLLIITLDGPLQKADFEQLSSEVDPFIASNGKLAGLMICAKSFPGWDSFAALVSHLRFVADHHRAIKRIAAVTDSGLLKIMPSLANHFVQAEIRHFNLAEKDQALAWLEQADARADLDRA
jgi:SpoIIAA-like